MPLNGVGRFTFVAQAPPVQQRDAVRGDVRAGRRDPVLDARRARDDQYIVRPQVPPVLAIRTPPASATLGAPLTVTATATDNVRVQRVDFSLGRPRPVSDAAAPWQAQLPTAGLAAGQHVLA